MFTRSFHSPCFATSYSKRFLFWLWIHTNLMSKNDFLIKTITAQNTKCILNKMSLVAHKILFNSTLQKTKKSFQLVELDWDSKCAHSCRRVKNAYGSLLPSTIFIRNIYRVNRTIAKNNVFIIDTKSMQYF